MNPRVHRTRVSQERWLVSYADFITLLFAFFVVLYAFAKADQKKQTQVSVAIDTAFQSLGILSGVPGRPPASGEAELPLNSVMAEDVLSPGKVRDDLNQIRRELEHTLSSQIAEHTVSLQMGRDGLVISLREAGFFNSGSARRGPHGQRPHSQFGVRLQLGAFFGPRHAHCPALPGPARHSSRPPLRRGLCRVPPCRCQLDRRRARRKPPRRPGHSAPYPDRLLRPRPTHSKRSMAEDHRLTG